MREFWIASSRSSYILDKKYKKDSEKLELKKFDKEVKNDEYDDD